MAFDISTSKEAAYLEARHRLNLAIRELVEAAQGANIQQRETAEAVGEEFHEVTGLDLNELV